MSKSMAMGSLALLWIVGAVVWLLLGSRGGSGGAHETEQAATQLGELEAENAWLRREIERLKSRTLLESPEPDTDPARKEPGPELQGAGQPAVSASTPPDPAPDAPAPWLYLDGLRRAITAGNHKLMQQYALALVALGRPAVPLLLAVARDPKEEEVLRNHAIQALIDLRAPEVHALLADVLAQADLPLSLQRQALGYLILEPGEQVPGIVRELAADPSASWQDQQGALRILMRAAPEDAARLVRSWLADTDAHVRKRAVAHLLSARSVVLRPLVEEALEKNADPQQARSLVNTLAAMKGANWSTLQMTGEPDTPMAGDLPTAWASKTGDMGEVWVELDFEVAVLPEQVRVHETHNPGAIRQVLARESNGSFALLWEGEAGTGSAPRWFIPPLDGAGFRTQTIRMVLDTDRVGGWNEIDAVELVGDGRRQWAVKARASSSYGGA